jgi:hypothetical protein
MPQTNVTPRRSSGALVDAQGRPIDADYVLTDARAPVVGQRVAADPAHLLALYRVRKPVRLALRITGWYDDFWTGPELSWTRQGCTGGRLRFDVRSDPGLFRGTLQHVAVSGTTPARTIAVDPAAEPRVLTLPLQPRGGTCVVRLKVSPVRVPANYPQLHIEDNRVLGVRVDYFTYLRPR